MENRPKIATTNQVHFFYNLYDHFFLFGIHRIIDNITKKKKRNSLPSKLHLQSSKIESKHRRRNPAETCWRERERGGGWERERERERERENNDIILESGRVGLGTTVEYIERKFKTKA